MEYYLTPSAKAYYPTPIDQSIWIVGDCAMPKLNCLFMEETLGKFCSQSEQLNVPVIFVTDEDLGKNVLKDSLTYINEKYLRKSFDSLKALMLPEWVAVPKEMDFSYIKTNIFNSPDKYKLGESESLQNPNFGLSWRINESIVSSDWLGIYQTIGQSRFIFIRIDEIMREPLLNNAVGVASVIIHELGHAIMDPRVPDKLNFRGNVSLFVANLVRNVLEESLANWIAYRCINGSSPYERNVVEFMRTKQSFPYSLGVMFGEAITSKSGMPFGEFRRYIEFWYKAKIGRTIEDVAGWFRLILDETSFTTDDLRNQRKTLFSTIKNKNNKAKTPKVDTGISIAKKDRKKTAIASNPISTGDIRLYPRMNDPLGRSGETKGGKYIPFKYGYVDGSGNWVIDPQFDMADEFYQGNAPITLNGKYGRLLPDGNYLIPPEYDTIWGFTEHFAIVKKNGKWGFIKDDGSILVPPKFDRAFEFEKGYAWVTLNGKDGYIDTKGKWYDNKPE